MAQRTTRNKIRFQATSAYADLRKAQTHLVQMAALAEHRSPPINDSAPEIIAALETIIQAVEALNERL